MANGPTAVLAAASLLLASGGAPAQSATSEPARDPNDARDGVTLPAAVHSVRVTRASEPLHTAPSIDAPRRGTAALDARLPVYEAALGPGCATRWVRVSRDAWICLDQALASGDPPGPAPRAALADGEVVPYHYAFAASAGVATYRRLEDIDEDERASELEQGMGVAVDGSARYDGRVFARTASGQWIAQRDLNWARPSEREGGHYDANESAVDVGFTARAVRTFASAEGAAGHGGARPQGFIAPRTAVHARERAEVHGHRVVRTDTGWIAAESVRWPEASVPPDEVHERERWVDVDTRKQLLVAFEGTHPVYTALVSSGRAGHVTGRGTFRVWIKLAASDMTNARGEQLDTVTQVYSVERVPWVMFFHDDQALHGAYWHDAFGAAHSHGCVNLAPRDAHWLFDWAPPQLPVGWDAVFPAADEPGLLVRVR